MSNGFEQISTYIERLGVETALRLVAGWGGKSLYVPGRQEGVCDHLISFVLGQDGAEILQKWYGHQTIQVPELNLRPYAVRANVIRMIRLGISNRETASMLSISTERVKQIVRSYPIAGSQDPREKSRQIADHSRHNLQQKAFPLFDPQAHQETTSLNDGAPGPKPTHGTADPRNLGSAREGRASYRKK